jgi:hypothetical protein
MEINTGYILTNNCTINCGLSIKEKQVIVNPENINVIYSEKVLSKGTLFLSKNPDIEKELKKIRA